uniref:Uncharacterized protein n=1 Tax=Romanomermis culicivorax TaxID=13658 RepID=A0A915JJR8_ROMCU
MGATPSLVAVTRQSQSAPLAAPGGAAGVIVVVRRSENAGSKDTWGGQNATNGMQQAKGQTSGGIIGSRADKRHSRADML